MRFDQTIFEEMRLVTKRVFEENEIRLKGIRGNEIRLKGISLGNCRFDQTHIRMHWTWDSTKGYSRKWDSTTRVFEGYEPFDQHVFEEMRFDIKGYSRKWDSPFKGYSRRMRFDGKLIIARTMRFDYFKDITRKWDPDRLRYSRTMSLVKMRFGEVVTYVSVRVVFSLVRNCNAIAGIECNWTALHSMYCFKLQQWFECFGHSNTC